MAEIKIKDNPDLKGILRNLTEMSFTTMMWAFYAYLLLPVLNVVLWMLGIRYFYVEIVENVDYKELLNLFNKMGWTILVVFGIMRTWGYYNYQRFGKRNRRKAMPYNNIEQLSNYFQIPVQTILHLQSKKEVTWPLHQNPIEEVGPQGPLEKVD
jgi:poly-beta-1,6-N-acetyl-D-glucosamine biosynthesis protein PgaD